MTPEERYKITSNDFADLIIAYNENQFILNQFQPNTVQIMNDRYAIVYVPNQEINEHAISTFGYTAFPNGYALLSQRSLDESGVIRIRNTPIFNLRGSGVMVGIIDTGIDYTNPIFRRADGTSKILAIWDQTIDSEDRYPEGMFYGTVYDAEQINLALQSENPYDIVPSRDEIGHGTMMAGIAAGSEDDANNFSGVAPDSDIVVVKLKQAKALLREFYSIPMDVPCYQENDIMWAMQYLVSLSFQFERPLAICIGLGTSQGSHDGRDYLSDYINVAGSIPGVAVTVAGGNEGNTRRHFYNTIDQSIGYTNVELNVGENTPGFTMELWGAAPGIYSIEIASPSGERVPRIEDSLIANREINFVFETTVIFVDYIAVEANTGDQLILMRFQNPSPGVWNFTVFGRGDIPLSFHIWLPVGPFISSDTYFLQANPYTTITNPGNALVPITVTAYNPLNETLYQASGKGYTRINQVVPSLVAPGVNILSPNLAQGFEMVTGTSAAAAHTAGITAMILEWGVVRENYPGTSTIEAKKFLIRGARRSVSLKYPNKDWGYGMLDIYNAFNILRAGTNR
ncbi:MAG: hypothetical protein K0S47_1640 [Herbinix sp.]|jgi:subtilisin family serine protease|nr:hypothetical protein [Herbinix sp.]